MPNITAGFSAGVKAVGVAKGQSRSNDLIQLAQAVRQSADRLGEIYMAVATLLERQNKSFTGTERATAADILKRLSKEVEMSLRVSLAERLASDAEAPEELILLLADDNIEVARPVLARSPVLSDAHLVDIIAHGSTDHHVAVAERPAIGETVSAALARSECEAVLLALLKNASARISHDTFSTLVDRAREMESLHGPLAGRSDLPLQLASSMYVWVSGALKTALMGRYPNIAQSLARAIEETSNGLQNGRPSTSAQSAKKLVDKLSASGQLKASFLIRALQQGQMELFEHGFATLLKMDIETMRKALYGDSPQTVALACKAAGIDRSVFNTVFHLSREHRKMAAALTDSDQGQILAVFSQVEKNEALDRLRSAAP
jgi:uncharacterized protein (DUF2336 family)